MIKYMMNGLATLRHVWLGILLLEVSVAMVVCSGMLNSESLGEVVRFVKIKLQGLCRRCEMHWTLPQEVFQLGKTWQSTCSGLAKIMDKGEICDMSGLVRHPLVSFGIL